jgi:hypothetical protein
MVFLASTHSETRRVAVLLRADGIMSVLMEDDESEESEVDACTPRYVGAVRCTESNAVREQTG